jgi:hypothetical protein
MTLAPAIILIIVAAIAGYVLGIIDSRLTASVQKKMADSAPATTGEAQPAVNDQNKPGEHVVLKVSIDLALKWHLELDKIRIEDFSQMNAEQRQRLVNIVMQIRPWIDGKPVSTDAPLPVPQPAPEVPSVKTLMATSLAQPPISSPAPRVDPLRGLRSLLKNEVKIPGESKSTSIVAMIDEVLQAKLMGTTLFSQGIRLEEGPMGEVIVIVGRNKYQGVDAVPEPEIRAIIKSAISDWEKK